MGFLGYLIGAVLVVVPLYRLLPAYRIHPLWSLAAATAVGLVVLLWVMALRADKARGAL